MESNLITISNNLYEDWKKKREAQGVTQTTKDNFVEWVAEQIELLW